MIITDINRLHEKSKQTTIEECKNLDLFNKLEYELARAQSRGVGLSAIQIDIALRAFIIRYKENKLNVINPIIEKQEDTKMFFDEGCLSFPGRHVNTLRSNHIVANWIDETGVEHRASFDGLEAVIFQHEYDHLEGIVMLDRVPKPFVRESDKVGRNDPCPCGSGKKYKKCCLK